MSTCTLCGAVFNCAMADGDSDDEPCWCFQLPALLPVPGMGEATACWCPSCLQHKIEAQKSRPPPPHD